MVLNFFPYQFYVGSLEPEIPDGVRTFKEKGREFGVIVDPSCQVGHWGLENPGMVGGVPARGMGGMGWDLRSFHPKPSHDSMLQINKYLSM